jgi:hypothetical protein
MDRVAFNDACFDCESKNVTEKTNDACSRSSAAPDDCFTAQLLGL